MATRLWNFLSTDVKELFSTETFDNTANAAEAIFGLAEALQPGSDQSQATQLAPLVNQIDSLLDVLKSPLGEVVEKSLPFVPIATGLLGPAGALARKPTVLLESLSLQGFQV